MLNVDMNGKGKKQEYTAYIEKQLPALVRSELKIENINTTIVQIQTVMSDAPLANKSLTENNIIRNQVLAWKEAFKLLKDDNFESQKTIEEKSTRLWGDIARNQLFNDGNKRLANLILSCHQIKHCKPPILIPIETQEELYQALIDYYEKEDYISLHRFLIQHQMKLKHKYISIEK